MQCNAANPLWQLFWVRLPLRVALLQLFQSVAESFLALLQDA